MRPVDSLLFRRRLEKACEAAVHDATVFPCEETVLRAEGKLEGLLHGAAAVLLSLRLDGADPLLLEEARSIVGRYRKKLADEGDTDPPPDDNLKG